MSPVIRRSSSQDSVIVFGETLRFYQSLPAAIRAAPKIGILRIAPVERFDRSLGEPSHLMDSAITEVHDLLRMSERPGRVGRISGVSSVSSGGRISAAERRRHAPIVHLSGEAAVSLSLKLAAPSADRASRFRP